MVLIGVGIFIATALLVRTQAEIAGATAATESTSRRAIAWSALQAVGAELHAQRRVILDGDPPRLDGQIVLFETGSVASVARLLPIGPEGVRLVAENGKIDVNTATVEMFVASRLMNEVEATALVTYRDSRPERRLRSLDELLDVTGEDGTPVFGPQRVLGELERVAEEDAGVAAFDRFEGGDLAGGEPALVDHVTVFSFEPELQRSGVLRIDVSQPWSEELGRRLDRRFGDGTGQAVRQVKETNGLSSRADIVRVLRFFNVANGDWVDVLDGLTGGDGDWRGGQTRPEHRDPTGAARAAGGAVSLGRRTVEPRSPRCTGRRTGRRRARVDLRRWRDRGSRRDRCGHSRSTRRARQRSSRLDRVAGDRGVSRRRALRDDRRSLHDALLDVARADRRRHGPRR